MTTQTLDDAGPTTGFSHEAYLYTDPARFLEGCLDFIRSGLAAGESVLVAVPEPRATWPRQLLRGEDDVTVVDMASLGANPARIIPEWRAFLDRAVAEGRPVRGIGEPVWAERSPAELAECLLHESLLNLAMSTTVTSSSPSSTQRHAVSPVTKSAALRTMRAVSSSMSMRSPDNPPVSTSTNGRVPSWHRP